MKRICPFLPLLLALAQAQVALTLTPARLELSLPPGGSWTGEVLLQNGLSREEAINLLPTPFTLGEEGEVLPGGVRDACPGVEATPSALTVPPKGEARVRLRVKAPVGEGTYACMLYLVGTPRPARGGLSLGIYPQLGLALYVTLQGTERPALRAQVGGRGQALPLLLENPGNVLLRLEGEAVVFGGDGQEVARLGFSDLPLLPGGRRRLLLEPQSPLPPGRYRAVLLLRSAQGEYAAEGTWDVP